MVVAQQLTAMPATLIVMILITVSASPVTMTTTETLKMVECVNQVRYFGIIQRNR